MHEAAQAIGRAVNYRRVGTVELLVDEDGTVSFLEVNTRLQVEHPVTEMTTGTDLVLEQFRLAQGKGLSISETPSPVGHAFEFRINAEDLGRGFCHPQEQLAESICQEPQAYGGTRESMPGGKVEGAFDLTPPVSGNLMRRLVADGEHVAQGDPIAVCEPMKMETTVHAHRDGTVAWLVSVGEYITHHSPLARVQE